VYPATIVGIPPIEDFYIGGASVKWFLPLAVRRGWNVRRSIENSRAVIG
jgi:hypothetical protein